MGFYFILMPFKIKAIIMQEEEIDKVIFRISRQIVEKAKNGDICLIGIQTRGVFVARRIQESIRKAENREIPLGYIDITLYRDDLSRIGPNPEVHSTHIEFDINDKVVVLVDDVLYTGRTVRCALDEIMDFGRPKRVYLAVLVDRGHRELPIKADFVGKNIPTSHTEHIEVKLKEKDGEDCVYLCEVI